MPVQSVKGILAAKLGAAGQAAAKKHAGDAIKLGQMDCPAGIKAGVAQLVDCRFMEIQKEGANKGKIMFFAAGIVKAPDMHDGVPVVGLRTSVTEFLFETPNKTRKTTEEHIGWCQGLLRSLGASQESVSTLEGLEATAAALKQQKPHFRFSTSLLPKSTDPRYKDSEQMVYHQWGGKLDWIDPAKPGAGVTDHAAASGTSQGNGTAAPGTNRLNAPAVDPAVLIPENEFAGGEGEATAGVAGGDSATLTNVELAEAADGGDASAANELERRAAEAGLGDAAATANNWGEVAALLDEAGAGAESGAGTETSAEGEDDQVMAAEEPEPEPWKPTKGEVCFYEPTLKNKQGKLVKGKALEVEVLAVNPKNSTAQLKNLDTQKPIAGADKKTLWIKFASLKESV